MTTPDTDRRALADRIESLRKLLIVEDEGVRVMIGCTPSECDTILAALRAGDAGEVREPPLNTAWNTLGSLIGPSGRTLGHVSPVIEGWRAWAYRLPGDGRAALSANHPTESAARAWVETRVRMEREAARA